ncbi:MAG: class I SAM-dependent methyltransferase [Thermoplasmata archaeon]|nr:MAG: class I SAM-dependent methyltransferase [Thermoplasmata archaeon]
MNENIQLIEDNLWQEKAPFSFEKSIKLKPYPILRNIYDRFLYPIRNKYLADYLSKFVSNGDSLLDIGCAEGTIPHLMTKKKKIKVKGVDVYFKSEPVIPFIHYDGYTLPFEDKEFNYTMAVDVLHHCKDIKAILEEMMRVSHCIIIKDHYYENERDRFLLKLFDVSANIPSGVNILFNFKKWEQWEQIFNELNLNHNYVDKRMDCVKLGPIKHFCILLEENGKK